MKVLQFPKKQEGFTLTEMVVSMGLLTFVIMISLNVISMIARTAKGIDYQVNVTQESNYAAERVRRLVRSADPKTSIGGGGNNLSFSVQGVSMLLSFDPIEVDGDPNTSEYVLNETVGTGTQSVMASNIYVTQFANSPFFEVLTDGIGDPIGVKVIFAAYDINDKKQSSGGVVSTQAFNRSIILNK